jgi:hypothetical protein
MVEGFAARECVDTRLVTCTDRVLSIFERNKTALVIPVRLVQIPGDTDVEILLNESWTRLSACDSDTMA